MNLSQECGVCRGQGMVFMVRPTTGPTQLEACLNCGGSGQHLTIGALVISFKREDELPLTIFRRRRAAAEQAAQQQGATE